VLYFRGATAAQVGKFADAEKDLLNAYEHRDDPQKWLIEQIGGLSRENERSTKAMYDTAVKMNALTKRILCWTIIVTVAAMALGVTIWSQIFHRCSSFGS
jgi:cytochrome b subunit of formate dehydrogenase